MNNELDDLDNAILLVMWYDIQNLVVVTESVSVLRFYLAIVALKSYFTGNFIWLNIFLSAKFYELGENQNQQKVGLIILFNYQQEKNKKGKNNVNVFEN